MVHMRVALVHRVPGRLALVPVARVLPVQMPVVDIVHMIAVRHRAVPAVRPVTVRPVRGVFLMKGGHGAHLRGYGVPRTGHGPVRPGCVAHEYPGGSRA
ncbi:hypothetical protein GCM10010360_48280 [Streptomyces nogalater]